MYVFPFTGVTEIAFIHEIYHTKNMCLNSNIVTHFKKFYVKNSYAYLHLDKNIFKIEEN